MEDTKKATKGQEIPCAQLGTQVCPHPDTCDGVDRQCTVWQNCSGK